MELSLVLAIIGLMIGAVVVAKDLQRGAVYQRVSGVFVQGWISAYESFVAGVGTVPGDSSISPTGMVNAGSSELCGDSLANVFLAAGISLPEGRSEGQSSRYAYLDSNGNPQELEICFQNVSWADPGSSVGTYVARSRNVMVLKNVTSALAVLLDNQVDGHPDARFGRVRQIGQANATGVVTGQPWSIDERMRFGSTNPTSFDEDQVAVTTVLIQMSQ